MGTAAPLTRQRITIDIAPDGMTACIRPLGARVREPVTEQEVLTALAGAEVAVDGSVRQRVADFVRLAAGKTAPTDPFVVAKGQPPCDAKDEQFVWDSSFETHTKDWQGDAQINYYQLSSIVTVDKDVVIGTIRPPVPSSDGFDVKGRVLKPKRTTTHGSIELDRTLRRSPDNPSQIISNEAGKLVQEGRRLTIQKVLIVKGDVNFATGSINSTTDVSITGAVPDRFEVRSTKSIAVKAVIEAARVRAEGDVVVRGGIVGRNAGSVSAGGKIVAKFCSEADLSADGDVMIGKQLMNSKVRTRGKLVADHAAVIGGYLYAAEGADVAILGSDSCTPTRIFVGVHPDVLAESAAMDERQQPTRTGAYPTREQFKPVLGNVKHPPPAQRDRAIESTYQANQVRSTTKQEENRRNSPGEEPDDERRPRLLVARIVYPGVTISFARRVIVFQKELKGPVVIEERRVKNVTETVAVNQLSGSIQILKSRQINIDELIRDFAPLAASSSMNVGRS